MWCLLRSAVKIINMYEACCVLIRRSVYLNNSMSPVVDFVVVVLFLLTLKLNAVLTRLISTRFDLN